MIGELSAGNGHAGTGAARIAVIGNMNNAGFSIMRYLRDLGADAWLLPFADDGTGANSHFKPQADTWHWDEWSKYTIVLPVPNSSKAIFDFNFKRQQTLRRILDQFSHFIGTGVAPALFQGMGKRLNIYWPYSIGIEFYGAEQFQDRMNSSVLRRYFHGKLRDLQAAGIREAHHNFNTDLSLTARSFALIGAEFDAISLPAVYSGEVDRGLGMSDVLADLVRRVREAPFSVFSAAQHVWAPKPGRRLENWTWNKHSDFLIRGFAEFLRRFPESGGLLALVEYGPDIADSKALIQTLGIGHAVHWVPVMHRREIMVALAQTTVGAGEFYTQDGVIWGSTGWEVLASGRPLLQSFNFSAETYANRFGHPPPPILDAKSADQVCNQLSAVWTNADIRHTMGAEAKVWFDQYGGRGLARKWLDAAIDSEGTAS